MKLFRILLTIFLFSASQVEELKQPTQVDRKEFTILDAKEFFEKDFASKITKSRNEQRRHGKLHPGDFTPLWDKAVYSKKGGKAAYDVSIMTDRRIAATRLTADGMIQHNIPKSECKGYYEGYIEGAQWADKTLMMDTGYKRRSESIGINYCFGKDKHQDVIFFKFTR